MNVRVPGITSPETAIKIFYEKHELRNADIIELFGKISSSTIVKLKNVAREKMIADNVQSWDAKAVNTEAAYAAWGLDVARMERGIAKLRKLGLTDEA